MKKFLSNVLLLEIIVILAVELFLLNFFGIDYFSQKTIYTGGDYPTHYYMAYKLRYHFLPRWKVVDWTNDHLCGYPLFQMYFPLPFLIIAFLSYVIPFELAFRIMTVLGTFLLPISCYLFFIFLRVPRLAASLGAILSLLFLFIPPPGVGGHIWGGNIPSTLAGEFSFSFSFAIFIILAGLMYRGIKENRFLVTCSILEALVGLSHAYTLLVIGFWSLFFLLTYKNFIRNLIYLVKMHLLAVFIMAWWLVPLLAYSQWTTPWSTNWSKRALFTELIKYPAIVAGIILALYFYLYLLTKKEDYRAGIHYSLYIAYMFSICILLAFITTPFGIDSIRFLPFSQFATILGASLGLALIAKNAKAKIFLLASVLFITLWLVDESITPIKDWVRWNSSGLTTKKLWKDFDNLMSYLRDGRGSGRTLYDKSAKHDASGSPIALTLIPIFSGRQTIDAMNFQASLSSFFGFDLQTNISYVHGEQFQGFDWFGFDLPLAIKRAKVLNVTDFIITADDVIREFNENPNFAFKASVGVYQVYKLKNYQPRYVEPLKYEPIPIETNYWRLFAYRWFQNSALIDYPFVFSEKFTKQELKHLKYHPYRYLSKAKAVNTAGGSYNLEGSSMKSIISLEPEMVRAAAIPITEKTEVSEEVLDNEIRIKTTNIKVPLLVKVSYHPNWRVDGADRIYRATPSFMIIFPNRNDIRLYYGSGTANIIGKLMSIIGLFLILGSVLLPYMRGLQKNSLLNILSKSMRFNGNSFVYSSLLNKIGFSIMVYLYFVFVAVVFYRIISGKEDIIEGAQGSIYLLNKGIAKYTAIDADYSKARGYFEKIIRDFRNDGVADKAMYYLAMTYYNQGNFTEALNNFLRLIDSFPESIWVADAWLGIAKVLKALGYEEKIIKSAYEIVINAYPDTKQASEAKNELRRLEKKPAFPIKMIEEPKTLQQIIDELSENEKNNLKMLLEDNAFRRLLKLPKKKINEKLKRTK